MNGQGWTCSYQGLERLVAVFHVSAAVDHHSGAAVASKRGFEQHGELALEVGHVGAHLHQCVDDLAQHLHRGGVHSSGRRWKEIERVEERTRRDELMPTASLRRVPVARLFLTYESVRGQVRSGQVMG